MCDPTIPLVSTEWEEWGNPNEREHFDYMASYDPMRTKKQAFPHILLLAGLNDYRVGYWEVAKWTQRVRDANTGDSLVCFKCKLEEGHTGQMDRYAYLNEKAFELAWVLHSLLQI